MWWRMERSIYNKGQGAGNKKQFKALIKGGTIPGILAYNGEIPIGWCAAAPRSDYSALDRSRVLKPLDTREVWSITCFFIARGYRKKGLSQQLIKNTVQWCKKQGAKIVEGYPVDPGDKTYPAAFAFTGFPSAFEKAGFKEIARRSPTRPIMRKSL